VPVSEVQQMERLEEVQQEDSIHLVVLEVLGHLV
jgi:hypothetical protein